MPERLSHIFLGFFMCPALGFFFFFSVARRGLNLSPLLAQHVDFTWLYNELHTEGYWSKTNGFFSPFEWPWRHMKMWNSAASGSLERIWLFSHFVPVTKVLDWGILLQKRVCEVYSFNPGLTQVKLGREYVHEIPNCSKFHDSQKYYAVSMARSGNTQHGIYCSDGKQCFGTQPFLPGIETMWILWYCLVSCFLQMCSSMPSVPEPDQVWFI